MLVALAVLLLGVNECELAMQRIDPNSQLDPDSVEVVEGELSRGFRNIDGTGNHGTHFTLGAAGSPLVRSLVTINALSGSRPRRHNI